MYQSLPYKIKQLFFTVIKLSIVVGCGYFIYKKLAENDQLYFSDFQQSLIKNDVFIIKNIIFLSNFTIFNWFIEILKWQTLSSIIVKTSFLEATKQSFSSLTASLITPNRIGEYGAKAIYFDKMQRKNIMRLNLMGNFYQLLATIIFGVTGFSYFYLHHDIHISFRKVYHAFLIVIFIISAFFYGAKYFKYCEYSTQKTRVSIDIFSKKLNLKIAFFSLLRYLIFSHQFYFLLLIFHIDISYLDALSAITSVYFIVSIVPMLSIFDVILKGTVAVWVFSFFQINELTILTITTLMWLFNFVFPAMIGSYFVLTFKPTFTK